MEQQTADATRIEVGQIVGPWDRPAEFGSWNRYAAVNDEFIPIHMDDSAARAAGMDGAFGMGNLITAWMHALLETWLDGRGDVATFAIRFRKPAFQGVVRVTGTVTEIAVDDNGLRANLDLRATDAGGDELVTSTATVLLRTARSRLRGVHSREPAESHARAERAPDAAVAGAGGR